MSFLVGTCFLDWLTPRFGLLLALPPTFVLLALRTIRAAVTAAVTVAWNVAESIWRIGVFHVGKLRFFGGMILLYVKKRSL